MMPAKSVISPTSAIAAAASHAFLEQSVPSVMNAAPTHASARYATRRVHGGPVNSTRTSSANEPNAAKSDVCDSGGLAAQDRHALGGRRATALISQDGLNALTDAPVGRYRGPSDRARESTHEHARHVDFVKQAFAAGV